MNWVAQGENSSMTRSLKFRLGLGALAFVGLALFFTWLALSALFTSYVMEKSRSDVLAVIDGITTQMRISKAGAPLTLAATPVDQRYLTPAGGHYWQIAENKVALLRSASLFDSDLPVSSTGQTLTRVSGPDGEDVFTLVNEVTLADRKFAIAAAVSALEIETETASFRTELARMMGLTAIALLIAALFQILTGLAPLRRLGIAAQGIHDGTLTHMPDDVPDELKPLTSQLNMLLDERNLAVSRAQARANDLAHGLKTPLTILAHIGERLQTAANTGDEGLQIQEQVDTVRQRVDRQLAIARISRSTGLATQLAPLAQRLVATLSPIAEKRGISFNTGIPQDLMIAAAAVDIAEVIGNVLDNAVEWTKSQVWLTAQNIKANSGRDMIRICVDDDGPGIAENQYLEALGRGIRLDESRKLDGIGSGLGLAIAADILEAIGGSILLARSDKGGLSVLLDWPKAT